MTSRFLILAAAFLLSACTASHPPGLGLPSRESIQPGEEITVENGQNVYAIAVKNGVSMRDIIALNELKAPYMLQAGQRLTLPLKAGAAPNIPSAAPRGSIESAPLSSTSVTSAPLAPPPGKQAAVETTVAHPRETTRLVAPSAPTKLNEPTSVDTSAVAATALTASTSAATAVSSSFAAKPPVQGPVLLNYGSGNDGINIGAPKGAPVSASAGGIVVYAGDEMKGFGNLVLIRHEEGWVTAYAHLDRMLVSKDSIVAAGDQIGTVGTSGGVSAPQLHFEVRQNGKPVDPKTVLGSAN